MPMRRLCVREHQRVPVVEHPSPGAAELSPGEAQALARLCERLKWPAVALEHRAVKFSSHCGLLQAPGITVEILPKITLHEAGERELLLRLLALASRLPQSWAEAAHLGAHRHSLTRALVGWFCDELSTQFHQGLVRAYVATKDTLQAVRGRWDPVRDALRTPGRVDRLYCRFDELTENHAMHQVLKAALRRAALLVAGVPAITLPVQALLSWLAEVEDKPCTRQDLDRLPRSRLTARYDRALQMARWFLSDEAPDLSAGAHTGLAVLFDMNALFQAALSRVLKESLPAGWQLREEGPQRSLAKDASLKDRFLMKPDLCVLQGDQVRLILDAKWKRLDPLSPDGRWGVGQADAYQLHAYGHRYGCSRLVLCYPDIGTALGLERPRFQFISGHDGAPQMCLAVETWSLGSCPGTPWLAGLREQVGRWLERHLLTAAPALQG